MKSATLAGSLLNLVRLPSSSRRIGDLEKITIPSDLRFHPQALSVNVENSCEPSFAKARRLRRAKPLRVSAITLEFRIVHQRFLRSINDHANSRISTSTSRDRTRLLPTKRV
jgi:hypothetical protein